MNVKMSKVRKQLATTRMDQLEGFRKQARVRCCVRNINESEFFNLWVLQNTFWPHFVFSIDIFQKLEQDTTISKNNNTHTIPWIFSTRERQFE